MKRSSAVLAMLVLFSTTGHFGYAGAPPYLELEMTGRDYLPLVESQRPNRRDSLDEILAMGKRLLGWIAFINQSRPPDDQISMSSAATQGATPIDQAYLYNPSLIRASYAALKDRLPRWLSQVLFSECDFPKNPPVSDSEFAAWGRQVDAVYSIASRWYLQEPYLDYYKSRIKRDVRGYYFLRQSEAQEKLQAPSTLSDAERPRMGEWLAGMCANGYESLAECQSKVEALNWTTQEPYQFYRAHLPEAKATWDAYFQITTKRYDVSWTDADLRMPFQSPGSTEIQDFLKTNIEDEWKWQSWALRLHFEGSAAAHVEFVPGVTPHVDSVGGNTLTMDGNAPLTEYNVRWTVRHEFGHMLGFPDCYAEFYDQGQGGMVTYQLDITDLMCSRRGRLKERHFDELQRVYGRKPKI